MKIPPLYPRTSFSNNNSKKMMNISFIIYLEDLKTSMQRILGRILLSITQISLKAADEQMHIDFLSEYEFLNHHVKWWNAPLKLNECRDLFKIAPIS